jgi:hypothetical protein
MENNEPVQSFNNRTILGILVGGGIFVAIMLLFAGTAITAGWIRYEAGGRLNLTPWLILEIIGGIPASIIGGNVCRRISHRNSSALMLAFLIFSFGLLESVELYRFISLGNGHAPRWLVILAPVIATAGILIGGWRSKKPLERKQLKIQNLKPTDWMKYLSPIVLIILTVVVSFFILPEFKDIPHSWVIASALAIDFTIVLPLLVYFLLVRSSKTPQIVIFPTIVVGYSMAMVAIPDQYTTTHEILRLAVIPVEILVIGYLLVMTRKTFKATSGSEGDFTTRFRATAREILVKRVPADIITTEVSILYHAFGWKKPKEESPNSFTVYKEAGYPAILVGLIMILLLESAGLHVIVSLWNQTTGWVVTGLNFYLMIWLIGDYRALKTRLIQITPTHLSMRIGVRWEADIPINQIAQVELISTSRRISDNNMLVAAILDQPKLCLKLKNAVKVIGMYGIQKNVSEIWLGVDDASTLFRELNTHIDANENLSNGI